MYLLIAGEQGVERATESHWSTTREDQTGFDLYQVVDP